ncbi:hypothetical protein ACFWY9_37725 [Amycolatopsis sp. NPDC059027]|uniref:hypothetical protein n=1 Tax=Amycolatopsis sp. NPDC059027 TaxID=3346709 RepID=UPI0036724AF9
MDPEIGSKREPAKQEKQAAAAALHALTEEGDVKKANFLSKLLEVTQEDNDKRANESGEGRGK